MLFPIKHGPGFAGTSIWTTMTTLQQPSKRMLMAQTVLRTGRAWQGFHLDSPE